MVFDILSYEFMQRALLGGFLIGVVSAMVGVFLVLKRLSLLGDSFAHASFGGIALGFVMGFNPMITALIFVGIASLGIDRLVNKFKIYGESAIAIILSFGMALALILISVANKMDYNIFSYLFGSILTISYADIVIAGSVLVLVIVYYWFFYKKLMFSAFNSDIAYVRDSKTKIVDKLFIVLASFVIVASIKAVGILLISALLVVPALIGLGLGKSFKMTIFISVVSSVVGIYIGIFISYFYDIPAGASIVMSLIGLFILSIFFKR